MREQASSLYDVGPYYFGKVLAELPLSILDPIVFSVIMYWAVGLNNSDASKFVIFCKVLNNCSVYNDVDRFSIGSLYNVLWVFY